MYELCEQYAGSESEDEPIMAEAFIAEEKSEMESLQTLYETKEHLDNSIPEQLYESSVYPKPNTPSLTDCLTDF